MSTYNEKEIAEALCDANKQRDAFTQVVEHYSQRLYWVIRQMVGDHDDANDLLQNTWCKAWQNLDYFRGDALLSTWLYRIAINETLTFIERERKQRQWELPSDDFLVQSLASDPYFDGDRLQRLLQEAIVTLPEKQRLVFNMRYFQEIKYDDMSLILGTSVGALKASYHLAVKKIEEFFSKID